MGKTIDQLPDAGPLTGTEEMPVWQSFQTMKTTAQDIANLAPAGPTLPLSIAQGGTGQATAQAALDALFASVTKGKIWTGDGANITGVPVGTNGQVLTADSTAGNGVRWQTPAGGGITIGDPITGGHQFRVLFESVTNKVNEDPGFTFDPSTGALVVGTPGTTPYAEFNLAGFAGSFADAAGAYTAQFGNISLPAAGRFTDGAGHVVVIGDGVNNITYGPGTPTDWNGAPPTDVWIALDRCATLLKALNGGTGP